METYIVEGISEELYCHQKSTGRGRARNRKQCDDATYLGDARVPGYALKQRTPNKTEFSNAYDDIT